jgi:hypothetical protein
MWSQYVKLKHEVTWTSRCPSTSSERPEEYMSITPLTVDELLNKPLEYDGLTVHVFGRVSNLEDLEDFFRLDRKLLVRYIYNNTNLQSQLSAVQNGDPMIVTSTFHYNDTTLYAENLRPSKD